MLGAFAVGKTSLVARWVHSTFSEKYLSTIGVKIDRKEVDLYWVPVHLLLWVRRSCVVSSVAPPPCSIEV